MALYKLVARVSFQTLHNIAYFYVDQQLSYIQFSLNAMSGHLIDSSVDLYSLHHLHSIFWKI